MIWYKMCLQCPGEFNMAEDIYGQFVTCAQSWHYLSDPEQALIEITRAGNLLYSFITATEDWANV